jgi:methionyl aminopeptidase
MAKQIDPVKMRKAAEISTEIMRQMCAAVKVGVNGEQINDLADKLCEQYGVKPSFKGVPSEAGPFPANLCFCINDEVLHAIPSSSQVIKDGDLVTVDFGIIYEGHYTDHCMTLGVGNVSDEAKRLLRTGKLAVEAAVAKVGPGVHVGDLGAAMHATAKLAGFDVVKQFVGHGIGTKLHLSPEIAAYGRPGTGAILRPGQVICVEAQVVEKSDKIHVAEDGWTIKTTDGGLSVMFEFMVEVTATGKKVLTDTRDWPILVN